MLTGYVAFIDVLGFSSLVSGDRHADRIDGYLDTLRLALEGAQESPQVEYVVFSDSIVLTTPDAPEASLPALLQRCSGLFGAMLRNEIAVRGAVAHGSYVRAQTNSGTFVAGRALIEAYQFETRQDWVGIMLAPSVLQKIPDLAQRCRWEAPANEEAWERLSGRLAWAAFVQPCASIPFHSEHPLESYNYEGFAIVPTNGIPDLAAIKESVDESVAKLHRLKSLAPDPRAQEKYRRAITWLGNNVQYHVHVAASHRVGYLT